MFKMNPAAKEFVPAHILKKRQEEAERVGQLSEQLDKVDLKSSSEAHVNGQGGKDEKAENSKKVQENSSSEDQQQSSEDGKQETNNRTSNLSDRPRNDHTTQEALDNGDNLNNNNHNVADYPEGLQELIDEEDDRFLLNAGESLCEFNGEQFIIPGDDDEYEPANRAGYDFGNAEDNEDEDVCNAFEEFLEDLPSQ